MSLLTNNVQHGLIVFLFLFILNPILFTGSILCISSTMALAADQRRKILKVLMISLLLDLV